jgi:hypothetical protein
MAWQAEFTNTLAADLVLFAGNLPREAYLAFSGPIGTYRDDPMIIITYDHSAPAGRAIAWFRSPDWRALMLKLRSCAAAPALQTLILQDAIASGEPAWRAARQAWSDDGPVQGTRDNPILHRATGLS